jgi:hypothetical protein
MYGSFFINSYDSSIVLHPHSFFNYYVKRNNNRVSFIKKIFEEYYSKLDNCKFYFNIINTYKNIFKDIFLDKLNSYNKKINLNFFYLYKFNLFNIFKDKSSKLNLFNISLNKFINIILKLDSKEKLILNTNLDKNIINKLKKFTYLYKIINKYKINFMENKKNKEFYLINNFIKSKVYKKLKFLYYKNFYNIKNFNFLYYKNKISKNLIKYIHAIKNKKLSIYKKFIKNINKYIKNNNNIKYKKFFIIRKENNLNKLKIRRFNIYPKIFVKMKDEFRYLYDKATVVTNQSYNYNFFT